MKKQETRYPSGLVDSQWIAECGNCGASAAATSAALAEAWERTHLRFGCDTPLHREETGRGWAPAPPVLS
ncbi:hypothetical protein [Pseudonocardia sp. N23]|uniref:hypothetical protein n=1 Tax=Pseudonocardia sp. N23 TaxID=1987376 RepID=UPI000BFCDB06|nr:hypothetical protein [Pseudonocardia sp. N23]GAY10983.1 hypothetical protein TOK_5468 [Pseudonocardia sp. N23]